MRILFLDDDEFRHNTFADKAKAHSVIHVRTAKEAISALKKERFDLACLDHDLAEPITGYAVAVAIEEGRCIAPREVVVHSYNPIGADRMVYAIKRAGVFAYAKPFGPGMYNTL